MPTMTRLTLTFDNGPSPDTTPAVLDALAARRLPAYFCVIGQMLAAPEGPALTRRCLAEGHIVVNHSMNHRVPLGDDLDPAHANHEILDTQHLLDANVPAWRCTPSPEQATSRGPIWFRPFGHGGHLGPHLFSPAAVELLRAEDYSVLLWNSVPRDWVDIDGWVDTALDDLHTNEHTVLVLHDLPTGAMDHLPRFLDEVVARGIETTLELPESCVPMRAGRATQDLASLTATASVRTTSG
jgi:peptidoglycan-N-acetylglucosamine deacetylase